MKYLFVIALLLCSSPAWATGACTKHGTVNAVSVQIAADRDIKPRSYVLIENSGNGPLFIAIGSGNNATTADIFLKPGASWLLTAPRPDAIVPSGDIAGISTTGGTTYAFCDY